MYTNNGDSVMYDYKDNGGGAVLTDSTKQPIQNSLYDAYDSLMYEEKFNETGENTYSDYVWEGYGLDDRQAMNLCYDALQHWSPNLYSQPECPPHWDRISCWPATPGGQQASISCMPELNGVFYDTRSNATLFCYENGTWADKSDYSRCTQLPMEEIEVMNSTALSIIYFCGHTLSLVALIIAFSICIYFK